MVRVYGGSCWGRKWTFTWRASSQVPGVRTVGWIYIYFMLNNIALLTIGENFVNNKKEYLLRIVGDGEKIFS